MADINFNNTTAKAGSTASGGGFASLSITNDTAAPIQTISSASYVDTGLSVTFNTTLANQKVMLFSSYTIQFTSGVSPYFYYAYKLDAEADVEIDFKLRIATEYFRRQTVSLLTIATPGSHTITMRALIQSGTVDLQNAEMQVLV
jgi:hypothetical protein